MKLSEYAAHMRAAGVRRVAFSVGCQFDAPDGGYGPALDEIELEPPHPDTMPAPPLDFEAETEQKAPGTCSVGGCQEKAGFHFAPHMCERHGLSQLGVKT